MFINLDGDGDGEVELLHLPHPTHLLDYHYNYAAYIRRLPTAELRLTLTYQRLLTTPVEAPGVAKSAKEEEKR